MSKERGTYNRRNWVQRWKGRILNAVENEQEKLARRYNVGGGWRKPLIRQEAVNPAQLIQATPGQFKESKKKGLKTLFGFLKSKGKRRR